MGIGRHLRAPGHIPALIWKNLKHPFSQKAAEQRYDRRNGIDTGGYMEPKEFFGVEGGQAYVPTPPDVANFLIERIAQSAAGFTFVDVGSGKGRVLLIAAKFPFSKVIGFEYSEKLNEIAAKNIEQFTMQIAASAPIELVPGDATKLPLPAGPLVLFLFNPFQLEMARDFAASIKASYQNEPRKIICIYYNPMHPEIFDGLGIWAAREIVECPRDPADLFAHLKFPAIIYETAAV
jgi:SAM-dependent methyltransferase